MLALLVGIAFALVFIVGPFALVIGVLIYAATRATSWVNTCRKCGYDLRGLSTARRCPECGQAFKVNQRGDAIS